MTRAVVFGVPTLFLMALASPALAQRDAKVPDPDPEIERQSFQVAEGFEVNLYAADPLIAKPIQMNFDPAGRLWLVSSEVYPQIQPGQQANDRVLILADRDGDGRADSTTVFADGLLIPTGVEPGDGGAYVANSTELVHFRDADNDGRADAKRIVLSGFGTEDTHHILHTLRWGFDGQLYMNQSIYIHSHVETPWGVRRLNGGGIWEFRPETRELAVFIRGLVNPWGHHFDRWGQSFATDGAGGEGINYALPGAYYTTAPDAVRILQGLNPGSPKHCGLEVVSGRHLPDDWQGNLITNDFRANRVCRFVVTDDGAGFASREMPELIRATHPAFRPIDVKMGPDGAIYVADWYNPIIQHGEVDFRDPRRDHTRGRIWRITAKGRPLVERPKLVDAPVPALLDALKSPEGWTRGQARRVLKERGAGEVLPVLSGWAAALDPTDGGFESNRLEALWTYQALDVVEPILLQSCLESPDPRVRAAAVRVLKHWAGRIDDPLGKLEARVEDDNPRVRLEAVRALGSIPGVRSAELAMRALDRPMDRFLDYALWLTARDLAPGWLPEVQAGRFDFGGKASHLLFALSAVGSPRVVAPLVTALQAGKVPAEQRSKVLSLIGALGGPDELALVLDAALAAPESSSRAALIETLAVASSRRKVRPAGDVARVAPLLDSPDAAVRTAAARAVGGWGLESARERLIAMATDPRTQEPERAAAVEAIAALGAAGREALVKLAGADAAASLRRQAVIALAGLDLPTAARLAASALASSDLDDPAPIFEAFRARQGGPAALAAALSGVALSADVAKLGVRVARGNGTENPALVEAIEKAGGLQAQRPLPTAEERQQLLAEVAAHGDAARGEAIFRRKDSACLKCHAIAGAGGQVGPSLESIGASAPADYLLDSILEPNKAIKENYHSLVIATKDGRILNGIKVRQSDDSLAVRDAEDREVTVPVAEIEEQKPGGSLMPAGQADVLTRAELVDLLAFLGSLGKPGPYTIGAARLARRWEVLDPAPELVGELQRLGAVSAVRGDPTFAWRPFYATVAGTLPRGELPANPPNFGATPVSLVRTQCDVTQPGRLIIAANAAPGKFEAWVDGVQVEATPEMTLDLSPGLHTLTFALPRDDQAADFRCELRDAPGSTARARFVVGK